MCLFVCLLLAATRTNNTVCAPCEDATYSNVTDSQSPCLPHTRSVSVWCVSVHSVCPSTSAFWGTQSVSSCSDQAWLLMSQSLVICPKLRSHACTRTSTRSLYRKFAVGVNRPHSRIVNICSDAFSLGQHSILMFIFFTVLMFPPYFSLLSCEEFGRVLKTPGTPTSNAICGEFKNSELPKKKDFYTLVLSFLTRWRKPEATCCVLASEFLLTLYFLPRGGGAMRRRRPLDDDLSWPTAIPTSIYSNPLQPVFLFCSFQHILHYWKYFLLSFSVFFFTKALLNASLYFQRVFKPSVVVWSSSWRTWNSACKYMCLTCGKLTCSVIFLTWKQNKSFHHSKLKRVSFHSGKLALR